MNAVAPGGIFGLKRLDEQGIHTHTFYKLTSSIDGGLDGRTWLDLTPA